ncbi:unnamed protein product, partial [Caenorhabditis auriculariae]
SPLFPDFFLPAHLYDKLAKDFEKSRKDGSSKKSKTSSKTAPEVDAEVQQIGVGKVYQFNLTGDLNKSIVLDLKNGDGSIHDGENKDANVVFTMAATDFAPMFDGRLKPTVAFMSKKLEIKGDLPAAMKLEGVLRKFVKSN